MSRAAPGGSGKFRNGGQLRSVIETGMLPVTGERYLSTPPFESILEDMDDEESALSLSTPGYHPWRGADGSRAHRPGESSSGQASVTGRSCRGHGS